MRIINCHYLIVLLIWIGTSTMLIAQQEPIKLETKIDSIWRVISQKNPKQAQYFFVEEMLSGARNQDTIMMSRLLEKLASNYADDPMWTSIYHYGNGLLYAASTAYQKAATAFGQSIEGFQINNQKEWLYKAQDFQAWSLEKVNQTAAAYDLYLRIEKDLLKEADSKSDTSLLLKASLKLAYKDYVEDDYVNALLRLNEVFEIAQTARDTFNMHRILSYLAEIQGYLGEEKARKKYKDLQLSLYEAQRSDYAKEQVLILKMEEAKSVEEATLYFEQLEAMDKAGKIVYPEDYLYSYATWLEKNVGYQAAFPINQQLLQVFDTDCSHKTSFYYTKMAIFQYYAQSNQYQMLLKEANDLLDCVSTLGDLEFQESIYGLLSEAFANLNQADSAYFYLKESLAFRDSARATKDPEKVMKVMLQEQFEQEKRLISLEQEKKQLALANKLKAQRSFLIVVSIISVLLLLVALLIYRNFQMQRHTNALLARQTKSLELSNQRLDRFASGVSHDILAKLNLILSTGNILVQNDRDTSALYTFYEKSMDRVRNLRDYCVELLRGAQLQPPGANAEGLCEADPILKSALQRNEALFQDYNITVVADPLPQLSIASASLLQIFQNLLGNAARALKEQDNGQIQIQVKKSSTYTCVGILDNGPGIPIEKRAQVFEQGVTYAEGNGLGLALVKRLVEEAGGSVWVEESPQAGAAIWMRFPT